MGNFIAKLKGKQRIYATVTRADGSVINLGRVDGLLPWRAWIYKLRCKKEGRI